MTAAGGSIQTYIRQTHSSNLFPKSSIDTNDNTIDNKIKDTKNNRVNNMIDTITLIDIINKIYDTTVFGSHSLLIPLLFQCTLFTDRKNHIILDVLSHL